MIISSILYYYLEQYPFDFTASLLLFRKETFA